MPSATSASSRIVMTSAIGQLVHGEEPGFHAPAETLERLPDAIHLDDVDPDAAYRHARSRGGRAPESPAQANEAHHVESGAGRGQAVSGLEHGPQARAAML